MYPGEDSGDLAASQAGQPKWEDHIGRGGRRKGKRDSMSAIPLTLGCLPDGGRKAGLRLYIQDSA